MLQVKKKKVDYAALNSAFMRIAGMKVDAARALLDLGFHEAYELRGRDPEALFADCKKHRKDLPPEVLKCIQAAVDFAEDGGL